MSKYIGLIVMICFLILPVGQVKAVEFTSERARLKPEQIQYSEVAETEFIEEIKIVLKKLETAGIKKEFLTNLTISTFPAKEITVKIGGKPTQANGYFTSTGGDKIVLAILDNDLIAQTLCHELGHQVENKLFNIRGYDWNNTGLIGQVYMDLRGYDKNIILDHKAQVQLNWYDRISEWWAEEVKMELMAAIDPSYLKTKKVFRGIEITPEYIPEVKLLMEYILFERKGEV